MADKKISALTAASAFTGTEEFPLVQGGITKKGLLSAIIPPPYHAGRFYKVGRAGSNGGALAPGINSLRAYPFTVRRAVTIAELGVRVTTGVAASNTQLGFYAADATTGAPTGAAIYSTPSLSTATSASSPTQTGVNQTLQPGLIYWAMSNTDNAGVIFVSRTASPDELPELVGQADIAALLTSSAAIGYSKPQTFGTWPTLTGSFTADSWTPVVAVSIPQLAFKPS